MPLENVNSEPEVRVAPKLVQIKSANPGLLGLYGNLNIVTIATAPLVSDKL